MILKIKLINHYNRAFLQPFDIIWIVQIAVAFAELITELLGNKNYRIT